jgi:ribosomal-protein-alanine N-acetyltransferase
MSNPIELKTKRLLLRPFLLSDAADVFEYASDTEWGKYQVNIPQPFTQNEADKFVTFFSNPKQWSEVPMFAMAQHNKVIGQVYLNTPDLVNERAEIGYMVSRDYWGQGLATEATHAVMDWGFQTMSINKIFATCDIRNTGSWRVMEKLGMQREGLLRNHFKWQGEFKDEYYYGILRREWELKTMSSF